MKNPHPERPVLISLQLPARKAYSPEGGPGFLQQDKPHPALDRAPFF